MLKMIELLAHQNKKNHYPLYASVKLTPPPAQLVKEAGNINRRRIDSAIE